MTEERHWKCISAIFNHHFHLCFTLQEGGSDFRDAKKGASENRDAENFVAGMPRQK